MQRRIAYVEDDAAILANYTEILRDEGFDVTGYSRKEEAVCAFNSQLPDLALLDVSLHGERDAGFYICSELRRLSSDLPIIFLTSHDGEFDKISGLRLGADDYISKDASIDYIVVRIDALFRRLEAVRSVAVNAAAKTDLVLGDLRLDQDLSVAYWKGVKLELSLTHYWLVRELSTHAGQVRSYRDLMKACSIVVENNTVRVHIKSVRQAFNAVDKNFSAIQTERGRGYRWLPA